MKIDASGKVWATWREWMSLGRKDAKAGREAQYPLQPDYMAGYTSEKANHAYIS